MLWMANFVTVGQC